MAHFGSRRRVLCWIGLVWLASAGCHSSHADTTDKPAGAATDARVPDDATSAATGQSDADRFHAKLVGDMIYVDVTSSEPLFTTMCSTPVRFEKEDDDPRVAPHANVPNPTQGYYLDGRFVPPVAPVTEMGGGCDLINCTSLPSRIEVGRAVELVKTGQKAPPPDTNGAPALVDVFETRAISGTVRIVVTYYTNKCDAFLSGPSSAVVEFDIPKGVCCPIGKTGCGSQGPAGGWARDLDACKSITWIGAPKVMEQDDVHGCPALVGANDDCCDCAAADAGL